MISFSIILPTYNNVAHCIKTIRHILDFDYGSFELIVINDGSSDGTKKQLAKLDDVRLTIIDTKNVGVSAARNLGLGIARNDYVLFFDDDS